MGSCQGESGFQEISIPSDYQGLKFVCQTWKNSQNNFFDYSSDSKAHDVSFVNILQSCKINYRNNQIETKQLNQKSKEDILKVILDGNQKILYPCENTEKKSANQMWLVVKSTPSEKYRLKEGDIIRIGKQKIKVKEIIIDEHEAETPTEINTKFTIYDSMTKQNSTGYDFDKDKNTGDMPICRVCLEEGQRNNPLIAPCKCSGSAKYIHIKCIQQWFQKLINPRNINAAIVISWKPLRCELCHESLAFKIYLDQQKHFTVNIPRPSKPYIVFNPVLKNTKAKIYYLVSFADKKKLSIGRKKQADIMMDQCSSISRFHSFIEYVQSDDKSKKPKFLLSDNDSKFGTLALLKKPVNFQQNMSGLTFQFGRSVLTAIYGKNRIKKKAAWSSQDEFNNEESSSESEDGDEQERNQ